MQAHLYNNVSRFFQLLKPNRKAIYQIYFFAIFSGLLSLSLPLGIQAIINFLQFGKVSSSWIFLVCFVIAGIAANGVLYVMQLSISEHIQQNIFARSSFDFAYRFPRIKEDNIDNFYAPEIANRFFDVLTIQKGLPKILLDVTTAIMQIFFGIVLLALYHPFFIIFALLLVILIAVILWVSYKPAMQSSMTESKYKYKVVYWLQEIARARGTFKLAGNSQLPLEKNDRLVSKYLAYRSKHFSVLKSIYGFLISFKIIVALGLLLIGGILVMNQKMNIGQFVAAEIIILLIMNSVEKLISTSDVIFDVLTASEKLHFINQFPLEKEEGISLASNDEKKGLEVKLSNVTIHLDVNNSSLENINLHIKPGEKIAVAGYERSGKSTLLKVIAGLFDHYQGSITYNDIPRQNLNPLSLWSFIGDSLSQEEIFEGSIAENISLGRPNITISDITWACELVGLKSQIEHLPQGYETRLEAAGLQLSKSTCKRIILARSIVDKPKLLLFDSQTLDTLTEKEVANFMNQSYFAFTLVFISNQKKLSRYCDRLIILKDGKIIEEGIEETLKHAPHVLK